MTLSESRSRGTLASTWPAGTIETSLSLMSDDPSLEWPCIMVLHEHSDEALKDKLATGELGSKKAAVAEAVLRRRRAERVQSWLGKHPLLGTLLGALGITALLLPKVLRQR